MPGANGGEYGEQLAFTSRHTNPSPYGCQTWSAIGFSTLVKDTDSDGLVDLLEAPPAGGIASFKDPNGSPYPRLWAMGATDTQKDLFVEINSMTAAPGTSYGSAVHKFPLAGVDVDGDGIVTDPAGHDHRPLPSTLTLVGDALFRAGIRVHFDVGPLESAGTGYSVDGAFHAFPAATPGDATVPVYPNPATYFINDGASGGESIAEVACVVDDEAEIPCQFPAFPGTVGWKFEFQLVRDEITDPGTGERRFDPMRNGFFHYLLYSHSRGIASSPFPCLSGGLPAGFDPVLGDCGGGLADNPAFHVPQGASGVGDLPGFNAMVALGLSKNFTGTEDVPGVHHPARARSHDGALARRRAARLHRFDR